jgi:hypothetical protein
MFILLIGTAARDHAKHLTYHDLGRALVEAVQIFELQPVILAVQVVDQQGQSFFELVKGDLEQAA